MPQKEELVMRIEEAKLILPALFVIKQYETATTSDLIKHLVKLFKPTGEDAKILDGRKDTKFSQKVRNLVSHRETNGMKEYTDYSGGKYTLTKSGEEYLNDNYYAISYLMNNNFEYDDLQEFTTALAKTRNKKKSLFVYSENDMIIEGEAVKKTSIIKKRSKKLREAVITKYTDSNDHICCYACGFDFEKFYGDLGKGFIEIHHEKPIYQYSDDGFETYILEAIKNMKPLCSNCHRMIHRCQKEAMSIASLKLLIK